MENALKPQGQTTFSLNGSSLTFVVGVSEQPPQEAVNTLSSLWNELKDKAYRDAYVRSQISIALPMQIRSLRLTRDLTQAELAEAAGMSQPRIAEIEKPGKRKFNLETILRIASAFDVGVEVRFVSFKTLTKHSARFDPDSFDVQTFSEDDAIDSNAAKPDSLQG